MKNRILQNIIPHLLILFWLFVPSAFTQSREVRKQKNECSRLREIRHLLSGPIKRYEPAYPEEAKKKGISGNVKVMVYLNEEGKVDSAAVCKGHPLLRKAALDAALKAEFLKTQYNGEYAKARTLMTFRFINER